MSTDSELQVLRHVGQPVGGKTGATYHLIIHRLHRRISYVFISGFNIDVDTVVSELSLRRPPDRANIPLRTPFDNADLAIRIVVSRMSNAVGCDLNDWIKSIDPEYDILTFFLAARRNSNAEAIRRLIVDMEKHSMFSEPFTETLREFSYGIYVEAFP